MQQVRKIYNRINFMVKYRFSVYNHFVPTSLRPYADILRHAYVTCNKYYYVCIIAHTHDGRQYVFISVTHVQNTYTERDSFFCKNEMFPYFSFCFLEYVVTRIIDILQFNTFTELIDKSSE